MVCAAKGYKFKAISSDAFAKEKLKAALKTLTPQNSKGVKSNHRINIKGNIAIVDFDQVTTATDGSKGYQHNLCLLEKTNGDEIKLASLNNRGTKVWPDGSPETFCSDHWRCRFMGNNGIHHRQITNLLNRVSEAGLDFIKTENLYNFDGKAGYSV